MKNSIWNKRIPTLIGLLVIVIGIGTTTFLVQRRVIFTGFAGPSNSPKNIRITNVSDTSFTVSFLTDAAVLGSINFDKDRNLGQTALDEREQKSSLTPHTVHSISVKNLTPNTSYYFSITSGQDTFLQNGAAFSITTGPNIASLSSLQKKVSGKVQLPDGDPPKEAIVYLTAGNSQAISTLTKEDGSYEIPLNLLRVSDLSSYVTLKENSIIKMLIVSADLSSNIELSNSSTEVPTIILSYDYDFTLVSPPATPSSSTVFSALPVLAKTTSKSPEILIPKKDQGFSDQQPKFEGVALPNSTVSITIRSTENIQAQVETDGFGNWSYRPDTPLSPGTHTISITTRDALGILRTIIQSFVVYASGTQVAQSATPSATPAFSPSPTQTPTATPTPTIMPTEPPVSSATPTPTLPAPGDPNIVNFGIIGLAITVTGVFLFLLAQSLSL